MKLPLNRLSAATLVRMIAAGECSPESVTRSFLDAIAEHEPTVQAYAWFDADGALATARALHLSARRGPLHGLPVAVKDNIDTADAPTAHGSVIYSGHRPQTDAACVALLKDAGAYVLGKTVLAEFANFTPGPTRNPHAPRRREAQLGHARRGGRVHAQRRGRRPGRRGAGGPAGLA